MFVMGSFQLFYHSQNTGCPKINFTFLKFCGLEVNLPLQHQNHNLLEETCRIF